MTVQLRLNLLLPSCCVTIQGVSHAIRPTRTVSYSPTPESVSESYSFLLLSTSILSLVWRCEESQLTPLFAQVFSNKASPVLSLIDTSPPPHVFKSALLRVIIWDVQRTTVCTATSSIHRTPLVSYLRHVWSFHSHSFKLLNEISVSRHCATHQIRVILISAVVITSLLFPAIHLYFPSQIHTFALRLHALDSFLTPDDISSYFSQQDTRSIWEGHHDLHVREDNVARARCGVEGLLRLERVLVHSPFHDGPSSALNKETLLATLDLENRIAEVLKARKLPCLRTRDGSCLSISPLAYWNHDAELLASDTNILDTISSGRNVSSSSILIHPDMVLAGREASDLPERDVESAMFLVLSFFFPDTDCLGNVGHFAWLHALEDAVSTKGELILQARVPDLIALDVRIFIFSVS